MVVKTIISYSYCGIISCVPLPLFIWELVSTILRTKFEEVIHAFLGFLGGKAQQQNSNPAVPTGFFNKKNKVIIHLFIYILKWSGFALLRYVITTFVLKLIKYYRLPSNPNSQNEYQRILMTTGINWEKEHICAEHWTKEYRGNIEDLPDVTVPSSQILKMEKKRKYILKRISKDPSAKKKKNLKNLEQKLTIANSNKLISARNAPKQRPPTTSIPKRTRTPSKNQLVKKL